MFEYKAKYVGEVCKFKIFALIKLHMQKLQLPLFTVYIK